MVQGKKPKALWEEIRLQDNRVRREVTTAEKAVEHASHASTTTARVEYEVSCALSNSRLCDTDPCNAFACMSVHHCSSCCCHLTDQALQACFSSTKATCRLLIHRSSMSWTYCWGWSCVEKSYCSIVYYIVLQYKYYTILYYIILYYIILYYIYVIYVYITYYNISIILCYIILPYLHYLHYITLYYFILYYITLKS